MNGMPHLEVIEISLFVRVARDTNPIFRTTTCCFRVVSVLCLNSCHLPEIIA
jgi:hypothetical protein